MINLAQVRADTPGCEKLIHLNNAGASLMPRQVAESLRNYISREEREGSYELAAREDEELNRFYEFAAALLHARPENIAFTSSATNGYNLALSAIPFRAGDCVLLSSNDYPSNYISFLSLEKRFGIKFVQVRDTPSGELDLDDLRQKLKKFNPRLVSISHIPTSSGLVQPIEEIGKLVHETDSLYLVDACQSVGQIPVHAPEIHADFLSGALRKFLRGPRGAGILYVSDKALDQKLEPLFIDMHGADWVSAGKYIQKPDAGRFEEWEHSYAGLMAAKEALRYALEIGIEAIAARNRQLDLKLRAGIKRSGKYKIQDRGKEKASIITFSVSGKSPDEVKKYFYAQNINMNTVSRTSAIYDFAEKELEWVARVSPHYYNTEEEIDIFLDALDKMDQPAYSGKAKAV
jgi:selenocysteine lyase/cysteine desulfurase